MSPNDIENLEPESGDGRPAKKGKIKKKRGLDGELLPPQGEQKVPKSILEARKGKASAEDAVIVENETAEPDSEDAPATETTQRMHVPEGSEIKITISPTGATSDNQVGSDVTAESSPPEEMPDVDKAKANMAAADANAEAAAANAETATVNAGTDEAKAKELSQDELDADVIAAMEEVSPPPETAAGTTEGASPPPEVEAKEEGGEAETKEEPKADDKADETPKPKAKKPRAKTVRRKTNGCTVQVVLAEDFVMDETMVRASMLSPAVRNVMIKY